MSAQKEQGLINYYRKPFLIGNIIILLILWIFTEPLFHLKISERFHIAAEKIGVLLLFFGILGRIFSSVTIASHKNKKIINSELYSIVRNPLYFFSFFMVVGVSFFIGRADLTAYMILLFILCFYPIILNEEKYLEQKFGDDYRNYKKSVPRLIPNLKKWHARKNIEINFPLVVRTLVDTIAILFFVILIDILEAIVNGKWSAQIIS